MSDFYEIDFLAVETKKSGDAIAIRYKLGGITSIHVVDGGYQSTGESMVEHIRNYYGNPEVIDHVVLTHHDGDHAGGLRKVLESFEVGTLWMLRPWDYAAELLPHFYQYQSVESLAKRLKEDFPNIAALDEIASRRGFTVRDPFQGARIGAFTVLAPSRERYLQLIVETERTPSVRKEGAARMIELLESAFAAVKNMVRSAWGHEIFPDEGCGEVNEMSVVQFGNLAGHKILLTGDAGRTALNEAADFAPFAGLNLPGIDRFQVPHHGSRRNVSSEVLDRLLGQRLRAPAPGGGTFSAYVSSALEDEDHPRKSVIRAIIHRGGRVFATEGKTISTFSAGAPPRLNWTAANAEAYPDEQEE